MGHSKSFLICLLLSLFILTNQGKGQSAGYELIPKPDIWYNDVDGIRLGLLLEGQVPGTFGDGPHRLDAGVWLGLWFPDLPVSYYVSFTEPITPWSEFNSEANIQLISSVRTGYHNHGIGFNKRWQQGFDERRYVEFSNYNSWQKRFNREYTAFPALWSERDKFLTSFSLDVQNDNPLGWYHLSANTSFQLHEERYTVLNVTARQQIEFNDYWGVRLRAFAGLASSGADPEYLFSRSMMPAIGTMNNGFTRAKGTIPQVWMESGNVHPGGGANLRGYTHADVQAMLPGSCEDCTESEAALAARSGPQLYNSFAAVNVEFDFWNPLSKMLKEMAYTSEFLLFRSYLFLDAGRSLSSSEFQWTQLSDEGEPIERYVNESTDLISNAGAGISLSINIPDNYGKPRGFILRYEIPFWLSDPADGNESFDFRSLFGFGAVISF